MLELIKRTWRLLFQSQHKRGELPDLPTFNGGGRLVDIADRDALDEAMAGDIVAQWRAPRRNDRFADVPIRDPPPAAQVLSIKCTVTVTMSP